MKLLTILPLMLCIGCVSHGVHTSGHPLFGYVPEVYITPGISQDLTDRKLKLESESSDGRRSRCTLSRCGSSPTSSHGMTPYEAEAWRLITITPAGFRVLLIREWGMMMDEQDITAKHADASVILFPFGAATSTNVPSAGPFSSIQVRGWFTDQPERGSEAIRSRTTQQE